ncbi:hypothetical protein SAMN06265221_12723 [Paracoccus laeviglucosivorans]|uniref:Helix-turn-helix domain-containing protein n=1 Tax=Paracoccus laeviglucosivorans TaxID=1197861 RepID=A0A521FNV9_9RHOB|nr:hypothetical protein SAMN06265221_12723 [Paracoccus laeviglucosivorans]
MRHARGFHAVQFVESPSAPHLTFEARWIFAGLLRSKVGVAQIAIHLGRHRLTSRREAKRSFGLFCSPLTKPFGPEPPG